MSRTKKLWIGVGCVIGVIFLIGIIGAAVGGESEQSIAMPAPTATTQPRLPTATSTTAECSPAEQAYADKIAVSAFKMAGYLNDISALSNQAALAPDLIIDAQWRREVAATLVGMERTANEMSVTTAPASLSAIREDLAFMAAATAEFTYLYAEGVTQVDGALLIAAADNLQDVNRYANEAAHKMGQVCG